MPKPQISIAERRTLTVDEVAAVLGISRATIYNLISDGELESVRIRGRRLVAREQIDALIAKAILPAAAT